MLLSSLGVGRSDPVVSLLPGLLVWGLHENCGSCGRPWGRAGFGSGCRRVLGRRGVLWGYSGGRSRVGLF